MATEKRRSIKRKAHKKDPVTETVNLPTEATVNLPAPSYGYGYGYGYGYSGTNERSLHDYIGIILRYWLLLLVSTVAGFTIAAIKTGDMPKLYHSSALINIGTYVPPVEGPTGETLREETRRANYINTQTRLLQSFALADRVLSEHPNIRKFLGADIPASDSPKESERSRGNSNGADGTRENPPWLLQAYLGMISFNPLSETTLVKINATSTDPSMAEAVANAHAQGFISLVQERRRQAANTNIAFLREKVQEAAGQIKELQEKRLELARNNSLLSVSTEVLQTTLAERFRALSGSLNQVAIERATLNSQYREMRSGGGSPDAFSGGERLALAKRESEYAALRRLIRDRNHPQLVELRYQIESSKETLQRMAKERTRAAREKYDATASKEYYLKSELEKLRAEEIAVSQQKVVYDSLSQEMNSAGEIQRSFARRLEEAVINAHSDQDTVALIDEAFLPDSAFSPNVRKNITAGLILGALAGLIMAFLLDLLDTRVHTVSQLQQNLKMPVLGVVPAFSKEVLSMSRRSARSSSHDDRLADGLSVEPVPGSAPDAAIEASGGKSQQGAKNRKTDAASRGASLTHKTPVPLVSAPFSGESEAIRGVITAILNPTSQAAPHTILITSGQKGEGKTTLALNLAAALAQLGERTVLVDADLRLPSVHSYFGLTRHTAGLVDCLTHQKDCSQVLLSTGIENMWVMLSGGPTANPAALLRSQSMTELLDLLTHEFDYIILDSPPIGPVADSLLLSRQVDGVAVVVRRGATSRFVAESAIARLRQVGSNVLGLVLNDALNSDGHWRIRYSKASKYYINKEEEAASA